MGPGSGGSIRVGSPLVVADSWVLLQGGAKRGNLLGQRLKLPCPLPCPEGAVEVVGAVGGVQGEHLQGHQCQRCLRRAPVWRRSRRNAPAPAPLGGQLRGCPMPLAAAQWDAAPGASVMLCWPLPLTHCPLYWSLSLFLREPGLLGNRPPQPAQGQSGLYLGLIGEEGKVDLLQRLHYLCQTGAAQLSEQRLRAG